jgi:hypothetical protein
VLFVIVFAFTMLQFALGRRWVFYSAAVPGSEA